LSGSATRPRRPARRPAAALTAALTAGALAACSPKLSLEADSEPIPLAVVSGVPVTIAQRPDGEPFRILIDTASALSAIDPGGGTPRHTTLGELRVLRPDDPHVVRAIFHDMSIVETPLFQAGTGTPVAVAGVLGGDVLKHYAVRFEYSGGGAAMTFTERAYDEGKPESDDQLAQAGRVVVRSYVLGGAAYEIGGDVESYPGSRLTLPACAMIGDRAVNLTLLVATGYGPLVLGRSAAERLLGRPVADAEVDRLYTPAVPGGVAVLERGELLGPDPGALAIVGDEHGSNPQATADFGGPCIQLFRHQNTYERLTPPTDCPPAPVDEPVPPGPHVGAAYVELCADASIGYAVISDEEPLLASVRAELRPNVAEIDGFAGTEVLKHLVTELNYTNNRVVLTCAPDAASCLARPRRTFP